MVYVKKVVENFNLVKFLEFMGLVEVFDESIMVMIYYEVQVMI